MNIKVNIYKSVYVFYFLEVGGECIVSSVGRVRESGNSTLETPEQFGKLGLITQGELLSAVNRIPSDDLSDKRFVGALRKFAVAYLPTQHEDVPPEQKPCVGYGQQADTLLRLLWKRKKKRNSQTKKN